MARTPKPTIAERAAERICPECSKPVERRVPKGRMPIFCSNACYRKRGNRRLVRGAAIIEFAQAWRVDRGSGEIAQTAFQQMCTIIDQFNAEDAKAKDPPRPRADLMAAKLLVAGTTYADRRAD